jgi:hypothetical protein
MGRRARRLKQLLDDLQETRGPCKFKEEVPHPNMWRILTGRSYGIVTRQTVK